MPFNGRMMIAPVLVGAGGYVAGVNSVKTSVQNMGSKISPNNPTTGVKVIGAGLVLVGGVLRAMMDNEISDALAFFLAGMGAGFLADPVPTPQAGNPAPAPSMKTAPAKPNTIQINQSGGWI